MKLLKKIAEFFKDTSAILEENAPVAVQITQAVKEAVEKHDGSITWVLEHLKANGLHKAYNVAKNHLPLVVHELAMVEDLVKYGQNNLEAWDAYTLHIGKKIKDARKKEWVILSAEILGAIVGKKVNLAFLIMATQRAYQLIFKKKAID
jgi:hypothetical protein